MPHVSPATVQTPRFLPHPGSNCEAPAKEETVKVEILYFSGCPNHVPSVERVREVLRQEGALADMIEVEVKDLATAEKIGFLGSPSIRIDGQDVEPAVRGIDGFGMMCRTYVDRGQRSGVPPQEWIRSALWEASGK